MRKHVYCEKKFLETCITKIESWKFDEKNFEELQLWMCIKNMIFSADIVLHLDIEKDDLPTTFDGTRPKRRYAEWEKDLVLLTNTSALRLRLDNFVTIDDLTENSNSQQLTACYLTCNNSAKCKECMNRFGVIAICPDNIKQFKDILYDNGTSIKKNDPTTWRTLLRKYPCNSLILIDNYALTDNNVIDKNFKEILDSLLPTKWENKIPFQITVFTTLREDRGKQFFNTLTTIIDQLRSDFYFRFTLYKCTQDNFHDRIIITNNVLIVCGGGFDLIRWQDRASKATTINIVFPYLNPSSKWTAKAYSNFLGEITSVSANIQAFDEAMEPKFQTRFYIGDKSNRLIT